MISKRVVEHRIATEQRPAATTLRPIGTSTRTVASPSARRPVKALAARFLEGTAWDEV
jgi:hypothetical protein